MFTLPFDRRSQLTPSKLQRAIPKQRQQLAPPSPLSSDVLMLQRTIGNRAVSQLLGRQRSGRQEEQQRPPTIPQILALRQQFKDNEISYDLFGLNCTAFVRDITRTAGLSFPGSKVLPFVFHGMASSFTPNKLYKALEKQQKKGVARVYANQKDKNKSKSQNKPSLGKRLLNMLTFQSSAPQVTSSNSQSQPVESQQSEQITQSQESVNQQAPVEPVEEVQDEFFPSPYENVQRYKLPGNTALTALDQNQVPVGTVQGGTTIGVTGVVRNGGCEIIWRGKPHYISERTWTMFVRVAYSDIARSQQNVSVGED